MMKFKVFVLLLVAIASGCAHAAADLTAISCLYEIKAEAYRFSRLRQQMALAENDPGPLGKLKSQLRASTQALMHNLQESKPGLLQLNMQSQHQRLDDGISDFLSTSAVADNQSAVELDEKRASLVKLANELEQQMLQKKPNPAAGGIGLIGAAKVNLEKMVYDFVTCDKTCAQLLPLEVGTVERSIDTLHASLGKHFKNAAYDLAKNQIAAFRLSVARRLKGTAGENEKNDFIANSHHLWEILDEVLGSYTEKVAN